jgi:hypothetical protein
MALQPFVGPWLLLSFLIFYSFDRTGGSARLKAATCTNRIKAHWYPCLEWDSNPRSQCLSGRRCSHADYRNTSIPFDLTSTVSWHFAQQMAGAFARPPVSMSAFLHTVDTCVRIICRYDVQKFKMVRILPFSWVWRLASSRYLRKLRRTVTPQHQGWNFLQNFFHKSYIGQVHTVGTPQTSTRYVLGSNLGYDTGYRGFSESL